jgi:hypothetical protein
MQDLSSDEAIWETASKDLFIPPPRQWTFEEQGVRFGFNHYHVEKTTLYELALLDIHSQYWETTSPEHVRRYHRGLQYKVEHCFRSAGSASPYQTPTFLKGWLVRVIFMKLHDRNGRRMVEKILNDIPKDQRLTFETGNFREDGHFHFFFFQ